jgi:hypothetical protein
MLRPRVSHNPQATLLCRSAGIRTYNNKHHASKALDDECRRTLTPAGGEPGPGSCCRNVTPHPVLTATPRPRLRQLTDQQHECLNVAGLLPPRIPGGGCLRLICRHACDQAVIRRPHTAGDPLVMWVGFALTRASVSFVGSAETKCTLPQPTGPAAVQSPLTAFSPSPPTPTAVGSGPICVGGCGDGRGIPCSWRPVDGPLRTPTSVCRCVAARPQLGHQTGKPVIRALAAMGHARHASIFYSFFFPPACCTLLLRRPEQLSRQSRRTPLFPRILGSSVCGEEIKGAVQGSTPSATSRGLDPLAFGIRAGALPFLNVMESPSPGQDTVNGVRTGR